MMGIKQRLKYAAEYDVIFARHIYCYLLNNPKNVKYWKRNMRRRRRHDANAELRDIGAKP